ncbi:MAG: Nucleotidyltransferase domain protein [Methanocella sp. PtaU1.Bin125]|nr:MAG: Nucleotidyltransferase domain protein [Methanocella sp. PtaU1.Bin125]
MTAAIKPIFTRNGIRLLNLFLFSPTAEFHQAEAIKRSGLSRTTVARLLKEFRKEGLLRVTRKGDLTLYSIVSGHPVVRQLKIFLNVTNLYEVFQSLSGHDIEVYLYGSAARGDDEERSDIDLLIIAGPNNQEVLKVLEKARRKISREINAVIYSPADYARLPETDNLFYNNVEKDKIAIITW